MCGQRREQILQSREGRLGWASEEATPRDPELTGQCEQSCSWEGTSDSVVGTREGAGRLVSCIESSEREGPTCSVTLARRSPPLSCVLISQTGSQALPCKVAEMIPGDSCKPVPSAQKGLKNHFLWLSNLDFIPRSMFPNF